MKALRIKENYIVGTLIFLSVLSLIWVFKRIFKKKTIDRQTAAVTQIPAADGSMKSSITLQQAIQIAKQQFDAMNRGGTYNVTIFKSLEGLDGKSLQMVWDAFGKPSYFMIGKSPFSWLGTPLDLGGWYVEELGGKDIEKMRQIWKKAGISF